MFYYLDQAATTALYPEALKAMMPYLTEAYGNPSSQHPKGQEAARALIMAREQAARALSVHPSEITFTGGGSESDNQALITGAHIGAQKGKRHLISTVMEHHAVLHSLRRLKEEGFEVTLLPISKDGFVSPESVKKALRPDTALVSVMAANNEIGTIQPIEAIGTLCHEKGVLFHTDAVQGAAHMDLDFTKGVIDMASFSAHKFHGPKGVGILYARQGIELESLIEGGAQERGKRAGTENIPAIVGMAAALEKAMQEKAAESARIRSLKERLRKKLLALKGVRQNGALSPSLPGTLNITFDSAPSEALLPLLGMDGICVSAGSACASGSPEPSHVLLALGLSAKQARSSIRFSLGADLDEKDIDTIVEIVIGHVTALRNLHHADQ